MDTGRLGEAESMYRDALAMERKLQSPRVADTLHNLAIALKSQRKMTEAETAFREALALHRKLLGDLHPFTANSLEGLGGVLSEQGKWAEAEPLLRECVAIRKKLYRSDDRSVTDALDNLIKVLLLERKNDEAEQLYNEARARITPSQPHDVGLLRLRARAEGEHCRFTEAIATLRRAIEIDPTDHELWHWLAVLLVQTGQLDAYRDTCRKSLARFGETTDPHVADRIGKDCLILPESGVTLDTVTTMANTAVAEGQQSGDLHFFQCCKGMAEYRQKRFAAAADWMSKVLTNGGTAREFDIEATAVLAMSQYHLQHMEQARAALAAGTETEQKLGTLANGNLGADWVDWIIAESLMREAKALIEGDAKATEHPK